MIVIGSPTLCNLGGILKECLLACAFLTRFHEPCVRLCPLRGAAANEIKIICEALLNQDLVDVIIPSH